MRSLTRPRTAVAVLVSSVAVGTFAGPVLAQSGAHQHGVAQLDVVLDGNALFIDLNSPAANLLGFERAPATDEEHAALDAATSELRATDLFSLDADAGCTLDEVTVEMPLAEDHDEHAEEHDDHAKEDEHEDEHGDEHDDHADEHDEEHSDVTASWMFQCDDPGKAQVLTTNLMSRFEGFETIDVQLAGPAGQTSLQLTRSNQSLPLTAVQ